MLLAVLAYSRVLRSVILTDRRFFGINLHHGRTFG
jgi:hypothetical protein